MCCINNDVFKKKIRDDFVHNFSSYGMRLIETDNMCLFVTNCDNKYRQIGKTSYLTAISNTYGIPYLSKTHKNVLYHINHKYRTLEFYNGKRYDLVLVDDPILLSEINTLFKSSVIKYAIGFVSCDDLEKYQNELEVETEMMSSEKFINLCKSVVVDYWNEHNDPTNNSKMIKNDVFVVWYCKELQNHKALLSTNVSDGMYYELTYNGDKEELYFDAYKKWEHKCIHI